jgi:hypothetical protein
MLDGTIAGGVSLGSTADQDQLAYDFDNNIMYALDGRPSVATDLYVVPNPPSFNFQGGLFGGAYVPITIEMSGGELIGVESTNLYRINPVTRVTEATIPLTAVSTYGGLSQTNLDWDCLADLDLDGDVDGADLGLFLATWGVCGICVPDFNGDGNVDGADLGLLLAAWGACP